MGRAIVRKPAAFLFDEPLSNLDAKLRVQMRVEIKRLQRSLGVTSIYVTHDQVEAMTMADLLVVMNGGIAEQIGTPRDIYHYPATEFVAGFMGAPAMNFLDAHIGIDGKSVSIETISLSTPNLSKLSNTNVRLGIRPEDINLTFDKGPIPVLIDLVEDLGADMLVHLRLQAHEQYSFIARTTDRIDMSHDRQIGRAHV